jgi:sortase A
MYLSSLLVVAAALAACSGEPAPRVQPAPRVETQPSPTPAERAEPVVMEETQPRVTSDGRPRRALLTIPAIGVRDLPVLPYRGWTDDEPGTEIQNGGVAASPYGPRGGVGPGGVGNYQVTAHRLSSTRAFELLPDLRSGQRVLVDVGRTRYVYEVHRTRETSFRSARSLAEQRAAVPGRPEAAPTQAFITLSTCATPEDHAAGNWWADQFGNPEHRIDKIGVLVARR